MWMGTDMFMETRAIRVWVDGRELTGFMAPGNNRFAGEVTAEEIKVCFTYVTATVPKTEVEAAYTVDKSGRIQVDVHYYGKKGLPELPVFGMRFVMPTKADGYEYEGLSGETYPDRMAGGIPGIYKIEGLPVTKYLVPQDCGVHMDTKWVKIYRSTTLNNADKNNDANVSQRESFGLKFRAAEENFAFSCIPYTAEELENATHHEELPPARRTVVSILGAVRGVGGIDSWGADVEEAYHISGEEDICYSFFIEKVKS